MPGLENLSMFLPFILLLVLFYFLLIRPQQKQQKVRQEMLNNLKKGDRVVTIGGIHGVIKEIQEETLSIRIADNINIKINRNGIDSVLTE
ncbi:MAG: preprotein translocase subunit YajC [Firmicutes bacterium]|jgi:preprotein translocase subunit YajC|nr:preprotein translocase subunit YajC [Bacillota bacterium]